MQYPISKNKSVQILLHIVAWLIFIILPHFVINFYWGDEDFIPWHFYINAALFGLVFYINYIWLVPRFFFKRNRFLYASLAILVIIVANILNIYLDNSIGHKGKPPTEEFDYRDIPDFDPFSKPSDKGRDSEPPPEMKPPGKSLSPSSKGSQPPGEDMEPPGEFKFKAPFKQIKQYSFILISLIVTGFCIGLRVIEKHEASEKRQRELEKEKLNSELAFLKNQVSPHFFFNTLNNIYSLVELNKEDAQAAILKLSKLMRYLLYESESGEVRLTQEIDFMKHYMDLMQLRISQKVEVDIKLPEQNTELMIPPLLFIPFIENSFKHGISYREKSFIRLSIQTENNKVKFICVNSINKSPGNNKDIDHSGIGLSNVKQRLKLLFPDRHQLQISSSDNMFSVSLSIDLKKEK